MYDRLLDDVGSSEPPSHHETLPVIKELTRRFGQSGRVLIISFCPFALLLFPSPSPHTDRVHCGVPQPIRSAPSLRFPVPPLPPSPTSLPRWSPKPETRSPSSSRSVSSLSTRVMSCVEKSGRKVFGGGGTLAAVCEYDLCLVHLLFHFSVFEARSERRERHPEVAGHRERATGPPGRSIYSGSCRECFQLPDSFWRRHFEVTATTHLLTNPPYHPPHPLTQLAHHGTPRISQERKPFAPRSQPS